MDMTYTAKIVIDIKATSAEHANELWLAAVQLIETSAGSGTSYHPGKGEVSFTAVETGNPDAGSLQRELQAVMDAALRKQD
ncbi:hypothetical protein [Pseudomonas sp. PS01301]|uniref:hypothetical protein n=1 Tax=Pseudomonas sp. PS01301 TaxID=2991437 RepID=UPI00249AF2DF|nr:hypothetical protein [Pseudomonas sp. PS01301]